MVCVSVGVLMKKYSYQLVTKEQFVNYTLMSTVLCGANPPLTIRKKIICHHGEGLQLSWNINLKVMILPEASQESELLTLRL